MAELVKTISNYNILKSAFKRVKENKGCRGSDGVSIFQFERNLQRNLKELGHDLSNGIYHPFPLMRFPIPKRSGKGVRHLSVPTVRDRTAQTSVFEVTRVIFEAEFEEISHAYRTGRGVFYHQNRPNQ